MRTKTRARARFQKSSRRSVSATTTARPLPSLNPEHSSNTEEDEQEDSTVRVELDIASENGGRESDMGSDSSDSEIVNTCLKCNKGGNLLICCGAGCVICLHDECIPPKPKFDEEGNFHCPYCWYKIHQARAQELKKAALLAKKALRNFMYSKPVEVDKANRTDGKMNVNDSNVRPEHSNGMDSDGEVQNGNGEVEADHQNDKYVKLPEGDQNTVVVEDETTSETHDFESLNEEERMEHEKGNEQVVHQQTAEILQDEEQAGTSNDHHVTEENSIVDNALHGSAELESEALNISKGNQTMEEKEEEIHKDAAGANVSGGNFASVVPEISDSDNETLAMRRNHAKQRNYRNADSQKQSSFHPHNNTSAEEASVQKKEASPSKMSRQPQAPAKKLTNLTFPHEKRKRLHWRTEEEEMLREGVQKFSTTVNKNLPWRKILEFGRHVFDSSRTPADLKDKWRNIVAKDSSETNGRPS